MINLRTALVVCVISAFAAGPVVAAPVDKSPDHNGNGWGAGGKPALGAPGPIAGAGLAFVVAGAYLVRRHRKQRREDPARPANFADGWHRQSCAGVRAGTRIATGRAGVSPAVLRPRSKG